MSAEGVNRKTSRGARIIAVTLGASIPISGNLDNVLSGLFIVACLLSFDIRHRLRTIMRNPIAAASVAFFLLHVVGLTYTAAPLDDVKESLRKAAAFLLVPLLLSTFATADVRRDACQAFMASMVLTLMLSYLIWLGVIHPGQLFKGNELNPQVFKYHITQNLFMAFSSFLFGLQAMHASHPRTRVLFAAAALLALFNVLFMMPGRTGHVVMIVLFAYFLVAYRKRNYIMRAGLTILFVAGIAAGLNSDGTLYQRWKEGFLQYHEWRPGDQTSVGMRREFYRNTAEIVLENPLIGVGTGAFATAYQEKVAGTNLTPTQNPHNEYLKVAAEFGIFGIAALLVLFALQWKLATQLGEPERILARGLVLAMVVASVGSSTFSDHAERFWYLWFSALLYANLRQT